MLHFLLTLDIAIFCLYTFISHDLKVFNGYVDHHMPFLLLLPMLKPFY